MKLDLTELGCEDFQRLVGTLLRLTYGAHRVTTYDLGFGVKDGGWDAKVEGLIGEADGPWRVEVKRHTDANATIRAARQLVQKYPHDALMLVTSARLSAAQRKKLAAIDRERPAAGRWVVYDYAWVCSGVAEHPWLADVYLGGDGGAGLLDLLGAGEDAIGDAHLPEPAYWQQGHRFRSEHLAASALADALRARQIAVLAAEPRSQPLAAVVGAMMPRESARAEDASLPVRSTVWIADPKAVLAMGLDGLRRRLGAGAANTLVVTDDADLRERIVKEPPSWLRAVLVCRPEDAGDVALRLGGGVEVVPVRTPSAAEELAWAEDQLGGEVASRVERFGFSAPLRTYDGDARGLLAWLSKGPVRLDGDAWAEAVETTAWIVLLNDDPYSGGGMWFPASTTVAPVAAISGLDEATARRRLGRATEVGLLRTDREPSSFHAVPVRVGEANAWSVLRRELAMAVFWDWFARRGGAAWCERAAEEGRVGWDGVDRTVRRVADDVPELRGDVLDFLVRRFEAADDEARPSLFRAGRLSRAEAPSEWAIRRAELLLDEGGRMDALLAAELVAAGEAHPHLRCRVLTLLVAFAASGRWATRFDGDPPRGSVNLGSATLRLLGGVQHTGSWSPLDEGGILELIRAVQRGLASEAGKTWTSVAVVLLREWFRWPVPRKRGSRIRWTADGLDAVWRECAHIWASLIRSPELSRQQAAVRVVAQRGISVLRDEDGHDMVRRHLVQTVVGAVLEVLDGEPEDATQVLLVMLLAKLLGHAPDAATLSEWLGRTALAPELEAVAWTLGLRLGAPDAQGLVAAYEGGDLVRLTDLARSVGGWDFEARAERGAQVAADVRAHGVPLDAWLAHFTAMQSITRAAGLQYGLHTEVLEAWCRADPSPFVSLVTERWGSLEPALRTMVLSVVSPVQPELIQAAVRGDGPRVGFALGGARFMIDPGASPDDEAQAWIQVLRAAHWNQPSVALLHRLARMMDVPAKHQLLDWWGGRWRDLRLKRPNAPEKRDLNAVLRAILSPPVDAQLLESVLGFMDLHEDVASPPGWDDILVDAALYVYDDQREDAESLVPWGRLSRRLTALLVERGPDAFWRIRWRTISQSSESFRHAVEALGVEPFVQLIESAPRTPHGLLGRNSTARQVRESAGGAVAGAPDPRVAMSLLDAVGVDAVRALIEARDPADPDRHDLLALASPHDALVPLFVASLRHVVSEDIDRARVFAYAFIMAYEVPEVEFFQALPPEHVEPQSAEPPEPLMRACDDPSEPPGVRKVLHEMIEAQRYRGRLEGDTPPHVQRWVREVRSTLQACYAPSHQEPGHD